MFKSIKHTWELFNIDDQNPVGAHVTMIATPFILSFGLVLVLVKFFPLFVCILLGIVAFCAVCYSMGWNNRRENELIARRLDKNLNATHIFPGETPHQYTGPRRWIALGRISPEEFISAVIPRDPALKRYSREDLLGMVEYTYMADTFSPRNSSPAIKYVPANTKGAYPVTHLKAPYDYFVEEGVQE